MKQLLFAVLALSLAACDVSQEAAAPTSYEVSVQTVTLQSQRRGTIPVTVYTPQGASGALPVAVFSTGALSSPEKYDALLRPWAAAGYAVVAPLHVDSESWSGARPDNQFDGLAWRWRDMNEMVASESQIEAAIGADLDFTRVAATGHSFGGMLAQVLGGAKPGSRAGDYSFAAPFEVAVIIAVSPPGPLPDYITPEGWSAMTAPHLLTTGTGDAVPMVAPTWSDHLAGHEAHQGQSWALVQSDVDHYFGNVIGRTEYPGPGQQAAFDEAAAITVRFLDAFLRQDADEQAWVASIESGAAEAIGLKSK